MEVGDQQITQDGLDSVGGEQSIQQGVGLLLVEPVERSGKLAGGRLERRGSSRCRLGRQDRWRGGLGAWPGSLGFHREPGRLSRRHATR
jgi:hypothetical protein